LIGKNRLSKEELFRCFNFSAIENIDATIAKSLTIKKDLEEIKIAIMG
jgi:hypothetical protein